MKKIPILLAGLPGNMASLVAMRIAKSEKYHLLPYAFTGEGLGRDDFQVSASEITLHFKLIEPVNRGNLISKLPRCIVVDFTQPSAANDNCKFYCEHNLPFVMGTTGGNRELLTETVNKSHTQAVIAPNMSIPVVMMMDMIEYSANNYPNALADWFVHIVESHQAAKKDKSGTAIAIGKLLCKLGVKFTEDSIRAVRDAVEQRAMGIPQHALNGHGFHEYSLYSPDGNVQIGFEHDVSGRETYVDGTLKAVDFLAKKMTEGVFEQPFPDGKCFSMIDVMRG